MTNMIHMSTPQAARDDTALVRMALEHRERSDRAANRWQRLLEPALWDTPPFRWMAVVRTAESNGQHETCTRVLLQMARRHRLIEDQLDHGAHRHCSDEHAYLMRSRWWQVVGMCDAGLIKGIVEARTATDEAATAERTVTAAKEAATVEQAVTEATAAERAATT